MSLVIMDTTLVSKKMMTITYRGIRTVPENHLGTTSQTVRTTTILEFLNSETFMSLGAVLDSYVDIVDSIIGHWDNFVFTSLIHGSIAYSKQ
jgi:hypothetical protein